MSAFELFDGFGRFLMPSSAQVSALDEKTKQRWSAVRDAAAESTAADDALTAAQARVTQLMSDVRDAEAFVREHFPAQTREAAIRDYLATERMKQVRIERR
jgi:uncharacterized protein YlxW (UPF0749 family)